MGLIATRWDLSLAEKVTASCFCRRRLPVVMVRSKLLLTKFNNEHFTFSFV